MYTYRKNLQALHIHSYNSTGQERNSNGAAEPLGGDGSCKLRDLQTGGGSREAEEGPPGPLVSNVTKLFNCHSQHLNL